MLFRIEFLSALEIKSGVCPADICISDQSGNWAARITHLNSPDGDVIAHWGNERQMAQLRKRQANVACRDSTLALFQNELRHQTRFTTAFET
jgi:hypothetical protein